MARSTLDFDFHAAIRFLVAFLPLHSPGFVTGSDPSAPLAALSGGSNLVTTSSFDDLSARRHAEYVDGESLKEMFKEHSIAERIAIESGMRATPASRAPPRGTCPNLPSDDRSRRCQEWMFLTIW